jgi:ribosomal protein S18 acetylase RimI-like enzyme
VEHPVTGLTFRRPTESDHGPIVDRVDDWWGGRRMHDLLPRLWFQHFTGTSWIAETETGAIAGFLVGFVSPDRPDEAYVHMVATNPNLRRRGVARELYDRFIVDVRGRGVRRIHAVTWPGNRVSVHAHRALGFSLATGPGTRPIHGTPAYQDYDAPGEDRAHLVRDI